MKITDIKTFMVDAYRTNWVFVKVYTDEGLTGLGEATLEYKEKALVSRLPAKTRWTLKNIIMTYTVTPIGAAARC